METMRVWGRALLDFAYPPHCTICHAEIAADASLCAACWDQVAGVAQPVGGGPGEGVARPFEKQVVWGSFAGELQQAIYAVKFRRQRQLGRALGWRMGRALARRLAPVDCLLPVPLHPARLRERGYNQSEEIALGLGAALGVPVYPAWVRRCKNTRQQALLPAAERRANLADAFALVGTPPADACIGLVDDVWTTGATMTACARALGQRRLWALALARPNGVDACDLLT